MALLNNTNMLGCLCVVLTNLLGLHSSRVLAAEAQLSDGHIIEDDVEVLGPLEQLPAHQQGNLDNGTHQQSSAQH